MINLVVALPCEAQPIVKHFKLKKIQQTRVYNIYGNGQLSLIVSGVGKLFSAAATAYLQAYSDLNTPYPQATAWLNVGIGGHGNLDTGTGIIADKISDAATGQCFYPSLVFDPVVTTAHFVTVDQPEEHFTQDAVYDMESSGFYTSASRFSSSELIHSFKVVSDNRQSGFMSLDKARVSDLITGQLTEVETFISTLTEMLQQLMEPRRIVEDYQRLMHSYHFTKTQSTQLKHLLHRWYALDLGSLEQSVMVQGVANSKELLARLQQHVTQQGKTY